MSTKRLWLIAGAAAAVVAIVVLVAVGLAPKAADAQPTPAATASASPRPSVTVQPSPTPTPTATSDPIAPVVTATCETTSTTAFRSMMASNGWISWETQGQAVGSQPFAVFPNGSPEGAIVCRWGADPALPTDDVIDLAWAPIDPENAVAAMQKLAEQGFSRTDMAYGVYLSLTGPEGFTDAEGWGETYFFGFDDVRWAATRADVIAYTKSPTEAE